MMSALSTSQIISVIICSIRLIGKFEWCFVVIVTTKYRSVMENDGFYMNLLTSDKLRVLGSDLLCFTDDLYSAYWVYFAFPLILSTWCTCTVQSKCFLFFHWSAVKLHGFPFCLLSLLLFSNIQCIPYSVCTMCTDCTHNPIHLPVIDVWFIVCTAFFWNNLHQIYS